MDLKSDLKSSNLVLRQTSDKRGIVSVHRQQDFKARFIVKLIEGLSPLSLILVGLPSKAMSERMVLYAQAPPAADT